MCPLGCTGDHAPDEPHVFELDEQEPDPATLAECRAYYARAAPFIAASLGRAWYRLARDIDPDW
jgi:hypothetical protein